ncbi:hypothetical protein PUN28_013740 [Cardiocondyla obscurior]|uniref:Uncharacterized protein n=1 Tax=Cardiocondyla obscurior TaxID=286306 RepID=A0AAW2F718_9HYME
MEGWKITYSHLTENYKYRRSCIRIDCRQRVSSPPTLRIIRTAVGSSAVPGVSNSCAEGGLDTSHLRGGAGPGRASGTGGATFKHRQNFTTPLRLMQFDGDPEENLTHRCN